MDVKAGEWAFNIGVVIALGLGVASNFGLPSNVVGILAAILVAMGLVVGFLNVTGGETKDFLLVSAVLILGATGASTLSVLPVVGGYLVQTFGYLMAFIVPATLVVCLKAIFAMSKNA